jgi:16S rRNA A1518/A1519 N6-dimethyltransferase RsmA/KsgA/DIM1 with predicted DNA glycosylase/AP lyase activity
MARIITVTAIFISIFKENLRKQITLMVTKKMAETICAVLATK